MQQTVSWKRFSLLGVVTFLFYLWMAWALPITDTVESNYALSAVTMMKHGDYLSPMIYDIYWFDKPIMAYWGLIASFSVFGVSDLAARIPSVVVSTMTVLAMYRVALTIYQVERIALWSSIALGTALEYWYIGHAVLTDGYLLLFSLGIFYYLYRGITDESHRHMVYAYICAGLAVLTKGPVGIVLPGIILVLYVLLNRRMEWFKYVFSWKGILAFIAVVAPWYGYMYVMHGEAFIHGFLGLHNVTRATVPEHPTRNWWYLYLVLLPVAMLPWTSFTLRGLNEQKHTYIWYWSIFWLVGTVLFYTCMATKYLTYTFIMMIPLALWTGMGIHACLERYEQSRMTLKVFVLYALSSFPFLLALAAVGTQMEQINSSWLWVSVAVSFVGLIYAALKRTGPALVYGIFLSAIVFFMSLAPSIVPIVEGQSGKPLATIVNRIEGNTLADVYQYGTYQTSLTYYLGRNTVLLDDSDNGDVWDTGKNIMPKISSKELLSNADRLQKALIYVPRKHQKDFEKMELFQKLKVAHQDSRGTFYSGQ